MSEVREEHPEQEEDRLRARPVLLLTAAALAMIAVGVLWPWATLVYRGVSHPIALGDPPRIAHPVPDWAAGMRQSEIDEEAREDEPLRRERAAETSLREFRWVDEKAGLVRIPIDDAMDLWLARHGSPRTTVPRGVKRSAEETP